MLTLGPYHDQEDRARTELGDLDGLENESRGKRSDENHSLLIVREFCDISGEDPS
jgi:hypothetical protein